MQGHPASRQSPLYGVLLRTPRIAYLSQHGPGNHFYPSFEIDGSTLGSFREPSPINYDGNDEGEEDITSLSESTAPSAHLSIRVNLGDGGSLTYLPRHTARIRHSSGSPDPVRRSSLFGWAFLASSSLLVAVSYVNHRQHQFRCGDFLHDVLEKVSLSASLAIGLCLLDGGSTEASSALESDAASLAVAVPQGVQSVVIDTVRSTVTLSFAQRTPFFPNNHEEDQ